VRSQVTDDLGSQTQQNKLAKQCWPVHEYIIELVRPRIILSIGKKAFEFIVRQGLLRSRVEDFPSGQGTLVCRAAKLRLGILDVTVISVPHLGDRLRYHITSHPEVILWLRQKFWEPNACAPLATVLSGNIKDIKRDVIRGHESTAMTPRQNTINDDYVFTYVRPIDDSEYEKIPGTAGHDRYTLFQTGMTVREFLDAPLPGNKPRRVDITYNIKVRPRQRTPNLELSPPDLPAARKARAGYLKKAM